MPRLPARFAALILIFAPLFRYRGWRHPEVLLIGAILAPGKRTVTSLLRSTGLSREPRFVNYHRVLNRALERARCGASVAAPAARSLCPERSGAAWYRRHDRAPRWQADHRKGDLPRSGALLACAFCQGREPLARGLDPRGIALDQPDAVGPGSLGGTGLGIAVPDSAGAFGAVCARARATA